MTLYCCKKDTKVSTPDGIHALFMKGGQPREIPEHLLVAAVTAGARPFAENGSETEMEPAPDEETVARIANVMREIIGEDNPQLLTGAGIPRANEIEQRVGFDTTKTQRDAAWAVVEG